MNRTIKFRGWSTSLKKWHFGYLVQLHGGTWINDGNIALLVDPESVGQMIDVVELEIGKHQEIYEGDIISRPAADLTYTVIYAEKYAQFMARDIDGDEVPLSTIVFSEVIGNIYDKKSIQD